MSGPATSADTAVDIAPGPDDEPSDAIEVFDAREARVGALKVQRALPQRARRTVGSWCFLDHGVQPEDSDGGGIGPHPHIGLQTVTWVLSGEFLHRDSLGSEQPIRPGELNLMTAGHGVVHAEERVGRSPVHVAQLWVAQPSTTRDGPPAFEHHRDLPRIEVDDATATVLVGELGSATSVARRDTDHFGADVVLRKRAVFPLRRAHEHVVVPLEGTVELDERSAGVGQGVYLAPGRDQVELRTTSGARLLLLGGVPFEERILMWWNYVARTRDEISDAHAAWTARSGRFGLPPSSLGAIDVGPPQWESGA
jgi:redox-sensitive bicupin YhaK (pirin superfamily)